MEMKRTGRPMGAAGFLSAALITALFLSACGEKTEPLPDVTGLGAITVVAREEGSGTRSEFESLVDTKESGTDIIASSTGEIMEAVAADINAIGYIASSSEADLSGARAVTVGGVEANAGTIGSGKYPLCRNYYLAYSGELTDVETDFLTYVLHEGQDVVSEFCVPVAETSAFLSDKSAGEITITGSTSAAPILEALAESYGKLNQNAVITISATDSTDGLTAAMRGECGFGMSSRELKDYEEELLEKVAIGRDGISIIVNGKSPVENLSVKQIKGIYDKTWDSWGDVE